MRESNNGGFTNGSDSFTGLQKALQFVCRPVSDRKKKKEEPVLSLPLYGIVKNPYP